MRPQIEESEAIPFHCGGPDPEEEKVWLEARVPRETVLCHEGLVVFQLFDWTPRCNERQLLEQMSIDTQMIAGNSSIVGY